jgi:hypothetical protein
MPKEKLPGSDRTFGGLNLTPEQERYLKKFLEKKGLSLVSFTRSLYRGWFKTKEIGVSDLTDIE